MEKCIEIKIFIQQLLAILKKSSIAFGNVIYQNKLKLKNSRWQICPLGSFYRKKISGSFSALSKTKIETNRLTVLNGN